MNEYIIDDMESEIIDAARSFIGIKNERDIIRRVRMYYAPKTIERRGVGDKSDAFLRGRRRYFSPCEEVFFRAKPTRTITDPARSN